MDEQYKGRYGLALFIPCQGEVMLEELAGGFGMWKKARYHRGFWTKLFPGIFSSRS